MNTAVVTGAGSGVGRELAKRLAADGWRVAAVGRRREALEETARLAGGDAVTVYPCDVGDAEAVAAMAEAVLSRLSRVDALVNNAGSNVPRRAWAEISTEDYHRVMAANLHGAFHCTRAFLPGMRAHGAGTIVNVVSEAGRAASPKAGSAYVAAKFGLAGLTQSINAEERANGIRASAIFPGDIDTPILDQRPAPPDAAARARMLHASDVARCIVFCLTQPAHVVVEELVVRPR